MSSSSASSSARSPEFQKQINEVQSRLTDFIEATRPAHEANLRRAAQNSPRTPNEPEEKNDHPKSLPSRRNASHPASVDTLSPEPCSSIERHSRKCKICNHPERDLIEADFLDWGHAERIAREFKVAYSTIYRHARTLGLIERRRQNLCPVVERVLESVECVDQPSAFAILRAVRTLACLTGAHWTEPPTTHIVVNSTEPPAESVNPVAISGASGRRSRVSAEAANRHTYEKLEPDPTHTKQTSEVSSNRHEM